VGVIVVAALLGLLTLPLQAWAQSGAQAHRIGFLSGASAAGTAFVRSAVMAGLDELGYREGQSVILIERYADGHFERLPALANELVQAKVEVLLTSTTPAALAAKRATSTIPIVVVTSGDLVGSGVVTNLARPEGNVTGLSFLGTELAVKQMEILKEIAPRIRRITFLANRAIEAEVLFFQTMEQRAPRLGVSVTFADAKGRSDYEGAFARIAREGTDGLVVAPNVINLEHRLAIVELAARARLPAVYQSREFAEAGGLISYGVNRPRFFRRAATYVDKIVKGTKPHDLPIEQPSQFELVINAKTARSLGLSIPQSLRLQADEILD
jgi:putative ABC transport system substrate-binding protein